MIPDLNEFYNYDVLEDIARRHFGPNLVRRRPAAIFVDLPALLYPVAVMTTRNPHPEGKPAGFMEITCRVGRFHRPEHALAAFLTQISESRPGRFTIQEGESIVFSYASPLNGAPGNEAELLDVIGHVARVTSNCRDLGLHVDDLREDLRQYLR
jgi:hypothetical protein